MAWWDDLLRGAGQVVGNIGNAVGGVVGGFGNFVNQQARNAPVVGGLVRNVEDQVGRAVNPRYQPPPPPRPAPIQLPKLNLPQFQAPKININSFVNAFQNNPQIKNLSNQIGGIGQGIDITRRATFGKTDDWNNYTPYQQELIRRNPELQRNISQVDFAKKWALPSLANPVVGLAAGLTLAQQQLPKQQREALIKKEAEASKVAEPFNQSFYGGLGREGTNIVTKLAPYAATGGLPGFIYNHMSGGKLDQAGDNAANAVNNNLFPEAGKANSLSPTKIEDYTDLQQKMRLGGSVSKTITEFVALQGLGKVVTGAAQGAPWVAKIATSHPLLAKALATGAGQGVEGFAGRFLGGIGGNAMFTPEGKPESVSKAIVPALGWGAAQGVAGGLLPMVPNAGKIPIVRAIPRALAGSVIGAATAPLAGMTPLQGAGFGLLGGSNKSFANAAEDKVAKALARKGAGSISSLGTNVKVPIKLDTQLAKQGTVTGKPSYTNISNLKAGSDTLGSKIDPKTVAKYAADIKAGRPINPIVVSSQNGQLFVQDGKHRLAALQSMGVDNIPIINQTPKLQNIKSFSQNFVDDAAKQYRSGKMNEKQLRAFLVDNYQQTFKKNPMPADIDGYVDAIKGATNRPYVQNLRARIQAQASGKPIIPVKGRAIADTAPQPGLPKGYKMTAEGDVVDATGRKLTTGEIQKLTQPAALTKAEAQLNAGKINMNQAEAVENKVAGRRLGAPIYETAPKPTVKLRGTIETVKSSPNTKAELRKALESDPYNQLPNSKSMNQAVKDINKNPQAALNEVLSNKPRTTQMNAKALILAENAQKRGDFDTAQKIFQAMAPGNTTQGQAIQILSVWSKTKPEGVVRYAQKVVDDANNVLVLAHKNPKFTLTSEQASKFRGMAQKIEKMSEGKDKLIATQKMLNEVHQIVPASVGEKLQSVLYYAQLLNPKTAIRNIVGNVGFAGTETLKDVVGAPIDAALTGARRLLGDKNAMRSVYLPHPFKQIKYGIAGGREAAKEASAGVNLSGLEGQLQIGNKKAAFTGKFGKGADKAMQYELSVPDRTFFRAREQQTLDNLMKGAKVTKPTKEMLDIAHFDGQYATFQDDSVAARVFMKVKQGLNTIGTKDGSFGLGSFVINYPKTPGNLLARGIDYSPAGFIKSTLEIAKPLFGKGAFNQKKFVDSFSRALVGTGGLVGTGALLHKVGIITGKPDKDKDVNAQDKGTGLGAYRINVSALKRFVTSGFDPSAGKLQDDDQLISYDWFQPAAIGISMGANIDETGASTKGVVGKLTSLVGSAGASIAGGVDTIASQPLVQGVERLFGKGGGITQGVLATAQGVPASFVPTLVNQINQLLDNTSRSTYDPNVAVQGLNMVKAKIPGLAQTLQPQVGVDGNDNERYQNGSNNIFNVMFNPAFAGKYQANSVEKEISRLQDSTGQTSQYPNVIKNTQTVNGESVQLSAQQVTDMQRLQGKLTQDAYSRIMNDPAYQKLSDTDKVKRLQNIITQANAIARVQVLGDTNDSKSVQEGVATGKVQYNTNAVGFKPTKTAKVKLSKASKGRSSGRKASSKSVASNVRGLKLTTPKFSNSARLPKLAFNSQSFGTPPKRSSKTTIKVA